MLRVTVEIVPFGMEEAARTLGTLSVINLRTQPGDVADYEAKLEWSDGAAAGFLVFNFERPRGWAALLYECFLKAKQIGAIT